MSRTYSLLAFLTVFVFLVFPKQAFADTTATLLPVNDGISTQWTPSTGTTHYTLVNEASCNGNTNYVSTNTTGRRDSYAIDLSSIPDGATINQISITPCASKNSSGGSNSVLNVFYRINGGTSADAGSYSLSNTTPTVLSPTVFNINLPKNSGTTMEMGAVLTSGTKGGRLSQMSAVITYTVVTPPQAPTNLNGVALSTEAAKLTWTDNATNETGYKVERSTDSATFTQIALLGANATSYTDANIAGTYYYRVKATNTGGDSAYSNTVSVTVALLAPTNLGTTPATNSAFLHWTGNSRIADGYKIERSTDNINFVQVNTTTNSSGYWDMGLSSGVYYYRIKAYKGLVNSDYSNTSSVTVL